jgi:hypothetical protein
MPYKLLFTYRGTNIEMNNTMEAFLSDYRTVLKKYGLSKILGLITLDAMPSNGAPPTMELTGGRANIFLPSDMDQTGDSFVNAMRQIEQGKKRPLHDLA